MNGKQELTHAEATTLLQDYLADELEVQEHALVAQHLQQCVKCQQAITEIQRIRSLLSNIDKGEYSMTSSQHNVHIPSSIANTIIEQIKAQGLSMQSGTNMSAQNDGTILPIAMPRRQKRTISYNIGMLVACVALALVVGSFLAFFQTIQHSKQPGLGHSPKPSTHSTVIPQSSGSSSPGVYVAMVSYLYKLDNAGKTQLWKHEINGLRSDIVVANDIVYAASSPNQDGSYVYAFRADDGLQLWKVKVNAYKMQGPAPASALDSMVVDNQNVYVVSEEGTIYALNAATGQQSWTYSTNFTYTNGYHPHQISEVNSVLYASAGDHFYALSAANGHILWTKSSSNGVFYGPLVANGIVYAIAEMDAQGPSHSTMYAWTSDGNALWHSSQINDQLLDAPVMAGNQLYATGVNNVYAFNSADGTLSWHSFVGTTNYHRPLVVQNVLYLALQGPYRGTPAQGSDTPNAASVIALNASQGSLIWEKQNMNGPTIQVVGLGVLYVEQGDGNVDALSISDRTTLWHYTQSIPNPTQPQGNGDAIIVIH